MYQRDYGRVCAAKPASRPRSRRSRGQV